MNQDEYREISLSQYSLLIKNNLKFIIGATFLVAAISGGLSYLIEPLYKADIVIITQDVSGQSGLMSFIAQTSGNSPFFGGITGQNKNIDKIKLIFLSESFRLRFIELAHFDQWYYHKQWDANNKVWKNRFIPEYDTLQKQIRNLILILEDKKLQSITIRAIAPNADLALKWANLSLKIMEELLTTKVQSTAYKERIFIETRLKQIKRELFNLSGELSDFYAKKPGLDNYSDTREVDIESFNPVTSEDEELLDDFITSVQGVKENSNSKKIFVPHSYYFQYLTKRIELLGQIHAMLFQQFELVKIQEKREDTSYYILDPALKPEKKFKPHRSKIVFVSGVATFIIAFSYVLISFFVKNEKAKYD